MRLYFQNFAQQLSVSSSTPLEASVWQALDIFENLPKDDGSFMVLVDPRNRRIRFSSYSKYVWLVEIPMPQKGGALQGFYPMGKCKKLIKDLFGELQIEDLKGFTFEPYK